MEDEPTPPESHPTFRVMRLVEVIVALPAVHATVTLCEAEAPFRALSFPIGLAEGAALATALDRSVGVRPSTHELFSEVLSRVNADVIAVRLVEEHEGIFHAELDTMTARGREIFSCRPSDGLILALRQAVPAPILVDDRLLADR